MSNRRGLVMKRIALVLGSTVLSLLLAELVLAIAGIGDPILRDPDPGLGWAPIPGAEGMWTREGRAHVRITAHGFRGVDHPRARRPGTLRVAIVGDSYTEAKQVALEESYPRHVEARLETCVEEHVEVLAFGVSGYGTAQEFLLFQRRVRAYDPDVVVLAFLTGNDVSDNHPRLRISGDPAPYFELVDGALVLDDSFRRSADYRARVDGGPWRALHRRSRLVRVISAALRPRRRAAPGELGLADEIYGPPPDATWADAWARTEAILARMSAEVRADGDRFFVVTLSNAAQVEPDPAVEARHLRRLGVPDLEYPDRRVAALGAREGFDVLALVPPLRAHARRHRVHLHGFPNTALGTGHWNARGHRVAGEAIGRFLCARLRPRSAIER